MSSLDSCKKEGRTKKRSVRGKVKRRECEREKSKKQGRAGEGENEKKKRRDGGR